MMFNDLKIKSKISYDELIKNIKIDYDNVTLDYVSEVLVDKESNRKYCTVRHPNGNIFIYKNWMVHNINGPAIIYKDGHVQYCLLGLSFHKKEYDKKVIEYQLLESFLKIKGIE